MAEHWNRHSEQDRIAFARALEPLVSASRTKSFSAAEARAYLTTLRDVPRDVLDEGVDQLLTTGVTWMPKPGEIKAACAAIVQERRAVAAKEARAITEQCEICSGSGWATVTSVERVGETVSQVERVQRCDCFTSGLALMAAAGEPLALPPAREIEDGAA